MNYRNPKLFIAFILGLASFFVTITSYGELTARASKLVLFNSVLTTELSFFNLTYKDLCIGNWEGQLEGDRDNRVYQGKGRILVRQGAQIVELAGSLTLAFNELDQLGTSLFKLLNVEDNNRGLMFGTQGTNPLKSTLIIPQQPERLVFEAEIPGPFILYPTALKQFGLQSPTSQLPLRPPPFLSDFQFQQVDALQVCTLDPEKTMDLAMFAQENLMGIRKMAPNLPFARLP
jgi:hypothetical protein